MPIQRYLFTSVVAVCAITGIAIVASRATRTDPIQATAAGRLLTRPSTPVRRVFARGLDSLDDALAQLDAAIAAESDSKARRAFVVARVAYKRTESLLTYYSPTVAGILNGPAEEGEADEAPRPLGAAASFQHLDELIGGGLREASVSDARATTLRMRQALRAFRAAVPLLDISDSATLDAARLELARVATLGVAGGDGLTTDDELSESAAAFEGLRLALDSLQLARRPDRAEAVSRLGRSLDSSASVLRAAPNGAALDRLRFVVAYIRPAASSIQELRRGIDAATPASRRLWRATAATPFDSGAFDPWALAPEYAASPTPGLIEKGRQLFHDPRLSGPGTRSCSSCHVASQAFADGRARPAPLATVRANRLRNTPTLLNAALQPALFVDERAGSLEDQVRVVLSSPAEMGSSVELAATRVGLDQRTLRLAIAAYIRSLVALDSRFDRAVRGDTNAMSAAERRGFTLFMGKARCGSCHFAPLFDGTRPPDFVRSELEIVGAPSTSRLRGAAVDSDPGRAGVDGEALHRHAFRVPSLRNVALTAPYMHNGVYRSLDDVIAFYDRGGGVGIGERLPRQTLPATPLHLSAGERRDLVAFLGALTDTVITHYDHVAEP